MQRLGPRSATSGELYAATHRASQLEADAAARGEEGKKNLGFKLSAAAKAAASFRALPVEVESIEQVKALVKAKELPGVGKASVERLQAWFETG